MSNEKSIELPSEMSSLDKVNEFAEMLKDWVPLDEGVYMNFVMAFNEAASNAILHGNKLDPEKSVKITAKKNPQLLEIAIQDQGAGFDPDALPDPTLEENLLKSGGRGIFIIRAYSDKSEFLDNGRLVRLSFNLS